MPRFEEEIHQMTLREVADELGISFQRVSQIYVSAMKKLSRRGVDLERMRGLASELESNRTGTGVMRGRR